MADSVNNGLPLVPENTIDPAAGLNLPLANGIDALMQVLVQTVGANSPPGSPANGARYVVGTSPTGAWAGQANKLARYLDSAWQFFDARYVLNAADGSLYVRSASTWVAVASGGGSGTVTSVAITAPTGFDVAGSPVTTSGTLALSFTTGYSLPTDVNQNDWSAAFAWGNHASAGYEKELAPGANITIDRTDPDNPVINATGGGSGSGKNLLINTNFLINQLGKSGTITLAAGAYGHDMWKAGASGCTYTLSVLEGVTTLSISAGSLLQIVEGTNIITGDYTLSWVGTSTGRIGAGGFSATPVSAAETGGVNLSVEFGLGTVSRPKLEQAASATPWQPETFGSELSSCQRYFFSSYPNGVAPGTPGALSGVYIAVAVSAAVGAALCVTSLPTSMRAAPTIARYNWNTGASGQWRRSDDSGEIAVDSAGLAPATGLIVTANAASLPAGVLITGHLTADARL